MKDQASVGKDESPAIKYDRALALFTESVMKPDHDLRGCAHNQGCYDELLEIREHVLEYLKTLKEVTYHTNADESDDIETAKLHSAKNLFNLAIWCSNSELRSCYHFYYHSHQKLLVVLWTKSLMMQNWERN